MMFSSDWPSSMPKKNFEHISWSSSRSRMSHFGIPTTLLPKKFPDLFKLIFLSWKILKLFRQFTTVSLLMFLPWAAISCNALEQKAGPSWSVGVEGWPVLWLVLGLWELFVMMIKFSFLTFLIGSRLISAYYFFLTSFFSGLYAGDIWIIASTIMLKSGSSFRVSMYRIW